MDYSDQFKARHPGMAKERTLLNELLRGAKVAGGVVLAFALPTAVVALMILTVTTCAEALKP